ncbi:MAG: SDR family NAD(P)-dependent oxidoreductase [Myxococcales bacterium]|nr:SDR family NAD(P)-dependent oxidoreductase [Myxococcota bacterium]MDW8281959.1 SDR family NAD(P)-dependent oxidoreductase [Myxococcales bacterium]
MANELRFDGRVAIVTGAGGGLGRAHALLLGARGARVVVNDLGGSRHGEGQSTAAADRVVAEIKALGGEAVPNYDSVEDGAKIVQCALDHFGRIDIVINNAGILRDTSFQKMTEQDWDLIYRVHLLGSYRVTAAAWNPMREAGYGRILFTTSAAGLYGNFGQANYSAAKMGLVGLANTLAIEGRKRGILVNTIAPIAGSRLTETVLPKDLVEALKPEYVSPLVVWLCHESCTETGGLFEVGGGFFSKLRWERTAGYTFKLSRPITPEGVRDRFAVITSFDRTTHPSDITASMQPVLDNLASARGKVGNEFIDVDEALGYEFPPLESSYTERDLALYALGVGAGADPLDEKDLRLVYELNASGFYPLPSFMAAQAVGALVRAAQQGKQAPGLHYGLDRVLHGEQYTEIRRPLPTQAKLVHRMKIKDIFDKGKNALVVTAITTTDESGRELCYNEVTTVVRGAGGWGGERGPSVEVPLPSRPPDAIVEEKTRPDQALLYRLSGDWNPLHADPAFARGFGFERPILHGLCTFGFVTRHVLRSFAGGDPRLLRSIRVRFADSVFPGETLVTEMWQEEPGRILLRCKVKERDRVVLSNAVVELHREPPKEEAPGPAPSAPTELQSADVFAVIADHLQRNPDLVSKVQAVFQWQIKDPDSTWTLDLKNGSGSVTPGAAAAPDVTLTLSEADFIAMTTGQADPQKLYFGGKLKITGNLLAAQKLEFLKKIDPQAALRVIQARRGTGPATASPPASGLRSEAIFRAIAHYLQAHPELPARIQTVFQWKLTEPDSAWVLDVKHGTGRCAPGTAEAPDVTLTLSEADFIAMATGQADPQKLYFSGRLKITGNLLAAQKLDFLKHIDREAAARALQAEQGSGAAQGSVQAPPAGQPAQGCAPAIFRALSERLASNPQLAAEVGALLQFHIQSPEASYLVDLRPGSVGVRPGRDPQAAAVFTLADADLAQLVRDPQVARDLFQRGRLRVDGDVLLAHRLGFLKNLG